MKAEKQTSTGGTGTEGGRDSERMLLTPVVPTRPEAANVPRLARGLREGLSGLD